MRCPKCNHEFEPQKYRSKFEVGDKVYNSDTYEHGIFLDKQVEDTVRKKVFNKSTDEVEYWTGYHICAEPEAKPKPEIK